jgi:hypothetical protein
MVRPPRIGDVEGASDVMVGYRPEARKSSFVVWSIFESAIIPTCKSVAPEVANVGESHVSASSARTLAGIEFRYRPVLESPV